LRHPSLAGLSALAASVGAAGSIDEKLSGCGTHMEQIVFVHDLFLDFDGFKRE
jgi:hypothetical protein